MPFNPFTEQGAFEPEATAAMGEAFDAACKELCAAGQLQMVRKLLDQRIIAMAQKGELDPVRLTAAALTRIMHHAERFWRSGGRSRAGDPSVWIGVSPLAVQHVWD
jgi:hypothetical protein